LQKELESLDKKKWILRTNLVIIEKLEVIHKLQIFPVGLGHVLSGIVAHLSSTVISATMAWHLVNKESRF
jgi:hypothetical protein